MGLWTRVRLPPNPFEKELEMNLLKRVGVKMKLTITRIEPRLVTCEITETGSLIDIARRWFAEDIAEGDTIEFEYKKPE